MLNSEAYKNEILEVSSKDGYFGVDEITYTIISCDSDMCSICLFRSGPSCHGKRLEWLLSKNEPRMRLTKNEYDFLRLLGNGYLGRISDGTLCVFKDSEDAIRRNPTFRLNDFDGLKDLFKTVVPKDDHHTPSIKEIFNCMYVADNITEIKESEIKIILRCIFKNSPFAVKVNTGEICKCEGEFCVYCEFYMFNNCTEKMVDWLYNKYKKEKEKEQEKKRNKKK